MLNDMPIMSTRCVYDHISPCAPPVLNLVQNLKARFESTLNDSINHIEIMDYSERNLSVESSLHLAQTPCRSSAKGQLWDSGLGSPTPGSSPMKMRYVGRFNHFNHSSNSPSLSPIPYPYGENSENLMDCSLTDLSNHSHLQLHCDYEFSILPHTPVCQNQSHHSSRKIHFSQNKTDAKLQRSLKKMRLSRSPIANNNNSDEKRSAKSRYQAKLKGRPKALFSSSPQANFNPFVNIDSVDKSFKGGGVKRGRDPSDSYLSLDSSLEEQHPSKKISLKEMNVCRFREEFHILNKIGDGQFGSVYKCINRLDGCVYAVKRSQKPVAGSVLETDAVNEVYAHAALSKHRHIIGYYSSWVEMDRVFIQTEYCNGGSLNNILSKNKLTGQAFSEAELSILLSQLADGLSFIHSQNLVHLDVKPDNIMVCYKCSSDNELTPLNTSPHNNDTDQLLFELSSEITYKIGDFGMVTSALHPRFNEGDCRYLPKEILQENTVDIQKADIFSLSLTIFEAGSNLPMPPNGPVWQEYRAMGVPDLKEVSDELNLLLKEMSNPEPILRPTASEVMRRVAWFTSEQKMNAQLANELEEQRKENEKLKKQLHTLAASHSLRLVGKSCCKSQSVI